MDFEGDAWFKSTPKGHNFFCRLYERGQDPAQVEWRSWQLPTSTNPYIRSSEIEEMRHNLPERIFDQEIMAIFLEDAGGVFRRVMDATSATPQERAVERHQYAFGVDWGRTNDFTAIAVLDATTREIVYLDRFNQIDYSIQLGRLLALAERFKPEIIIAERNSIGDPLVERLRDMGLPVEPFLTTQASKQQVIDALSLAFERGDLRIIPDPVLVSELQAYEAVRLPSGMLRYSAPEGMHDDCVISVCLAWQAIGVPPAEQIVEYSAPVQISQY
jgi:phage FluMu gp28-like protein